MSIGFGLAASAWPATHATGMLLLIPAALSLVWALVSFYRRVNALEQKSLPGLEDRVGPTLVFLVMTAVVVRHLSEASSPRACGPLPTTAKRTS